MATLNFIANGFTISGGSGLGFFNASFGSSVKVGNYQATTWITNAAGTSQGPQVNNIQYFNNYSGAINSASATGLLCIPNNLASLQLHFDNAGVLVNTQNGLITIYDSVNTANPQSGCNTMVYEIIHPNPIQAANGSGAVVWTICSGVAGAPNTMTLTASPGQSGLFNNGTSARKDVIHDWYIALSETPNSVGSKTGSLQWYVEYL